MGKLERETYILLSGGSQQQYRLCHFCHTFICLTLGSTMILYLDKRNYYCKKFKYVHLNYFFVQMV